ncbi:hypothetical protein HNQ10_003440 [Deinococcus metallilatus]|uniref:Uncharacterized protein n=1 Tax=Deinococcus metallilatus TaxID=1211322 RepID=A0ABR6MZ04_9DEIO|nr:hypothetical protein [Deinococcus metallilatus]
MGGAVRARKHAGDGRNQLSLEIRLVDLVYNRMNPNRNLLLNVC